MLLNTHCQYALARLNPFQWAPTLGGECYFGACLFLSKLLLFQWAPTLGGECYREHMQMVHAWTLSFNGHPPLGVNATNRIAFSSLDKYSVSMGTHPWG